MVDKAKVESSPEIWRVGGRCSIIKGGESATPRTTRGTYRDGNPQPSFFPPSRTTAGGCYLACLTLPYAMRCTTGHLGMSRAAIVCLWIAATCAWGNCGAARAAMDLAVVPLTDDRQSDFHNTWGGAWSVGTAQKGVELQLRDKPDGGRAIAVELKAVAPGETRYLQCLASGFGRTGEYYQTRDLMRYERLRFRAQNGTGTAVDVLLQLKDYRDSAEHCATYKYRLSDQGWTTVDVPLRLNETDWTVRGRPRLKPRIND